MTPPGSLFPPANRDNDAFLDAVETFANRKFRYRSDLILLMNAAASHSAHGQFEEIIFLAKFLTNASNVLRRVGHPRDETGKLSDEFGQKLGQISNLIRALIAGISGEERLAFESRFTSLSQESMQRLMILLSELAWVKNFLLDREDPA